MAVSPVPYKLPFLAARQYPSPSGVCGFTGTSKAPGMTSRQAKQVRRLLYNVTALHLGDCINSDAQAHEIAVSLGVKTIGHPPDNVGRRAYCAYDEERLPAPYLMRNRHIVAEADGGLIATPSGWTEQFRGSGTWATIRYARKARRKIWIIVPDGTIMFETFA